MHQPFSTEIVYNDRNHSQFFVVNGEALVGSFEVWRNGNIVADEPTFQDAENYCADNALTPDIIDVPEELM